MPNCPIGIFDSGVGGISVLTEIYRQLPYESLIYVADSAYAPYGDKASTEILERCRQVCHFFLEQNIKALVIACNTATAIAVDLLRDEFPKLPIIGLEPAVKPAVKLSKSGIIGILATEQTIRSERLQGLIDQYAGNIQVEKQSCPGLVERVEAGDFNGEQTVQLLNKYINPLLERNIDTLILGCTHYPFLVDAIRVITRNVTILETSIPVTQHLKRILELNGLTNIVSPISDSLVGTACIGTVQFYSSSASDHHKNQVERLWQDKVLLKQLPKEYC